MAYRNSRQCPANSFYHAIRPDDTLYRIAQKYRVSISDILEANPGINPYNLMIGQRVCIPLICPPGYYVYTVRNSDTLYSIALRHSATVQQLLSINPQVSNPDLIPVGLKLCVPAVDPIGEQVRNSK